MKVVIENAWTTLEFSELDEHYKVRFEEGLRVATGVKDPQAIHSQAYKMGIWDGITPMYDDKTHKIPTGLRDQLDTFVKKFQNVYPGFIYEIEDNRTEQFLTTDMVERPIMVEKGGQTLSLRDYQEDAVVAGVENMTGVMYLATNAGKCLVGDTRILTPTGYRRIGDIGEELGVDLMDIRPREVPADFKVVNRFGEVEHTAAFTVNGKRSVLEVTLDSGTKIKVTPNHPLMTVTDDLEHVWKEVGNITIKDALVTIPDYVKGKSPKELYVYDPVVKVEYVGEEPTFDLSVPVSNSFIAESIVSHNTLTSVGTINTIRPYLEDHEVITYVVPSKAIFNQAIRTFEEQYGDAVGYMGDGKLKYGPIMVVLMASLASKLKDPSKSKDVKFTGMNRQVQLFVEEVLPNFENKTNMKHLVRVFASNYARAFKMTKDRTEILEYLKSVSAANLSDAQLKVEFNKWKVRYEKALRKKVGDKLDKYNEVVKMVDNTALLIVDECLVADTQVSMDNGSTKSIQDLVIGDVLKDNNRVTHTFVNEQQPIARLIHTYGYLEGTLTHPVAYKEGGEVKYRPIMQLKPGDELVLEDTQTKAIVQEVEITDRIEDTYDIETENHTFYANGVLNHNCHHSGADQWFDTLMKFNTPYKFGMTGSIDYKNKLLTQRLWSIFHEVISEVKNEEMIARGNSSKPTIKLINVRGDITYEIEDLGGYKKKKHLAQEKDYMTAYKYGIVENQARNRFIIQAAYASAQEGKTVLVTVTRVDHGEALEAALQELGVSARFMQGEQDTETREGILQGVREGEIKVMIASSLVDEGLDVDVFRVIIMAAGGKSKRQTLQRVGRVLRAKKEDNTSTVIDFVDRTNEKLLYKHSKERLAIYKEEGFEIQELN